MLSRRRLLGSAALVSLAAASGGVRAAIYDEAPGLAARVAAGTLEPADRRLPANPLLVDPEERLGDYGGSWHMAMLGRRDGALLFRTVGYEPLVRWDAPWTRIMPGLAQSFAIGRDARSFTFRLRRNLRWSDGEAFTSADILFWYEDVLLNRELTPAPPAWLTSGERPMELEAPDAETVIFRFDKPNSLFLQRLASAADVLGPTGYPRHRLMRFHPRYNAAGLAAELRRAKLDGWVDLFRLKSGADIHRSDPLALLHGGAESTPWPTLGAWVVTAIADGEPPSLIAERNPYYWKIDPAGRQLPYIDRAVFHLLASADELRHLAFAGKLDMQARHIPTVFRDDIGELEQRGYRLLSLTPSSSNLLPIALNLAHRDPGKRAILADRDFRRALSHAIDRAAILEADSEGGRLSQVAPRPSSRFYDERLAQQYLAYDPGLADALLDGVGLARRGADRLRLGRDGEPFAITLLLRADRPDQVAAARAVIGDWRAVGVDTRIEIVDRGSLAAILQDNLHDAAIALEDGGIDVLLEPDNYLPFSNKSWYAVAWARWFADPADPAAQEPPETAKRQFALFDRIAGTADATEQDRLVAALLALAADAFYMIGVAQRPEQHGIQRPNFRNVPAVMIDSWSYPNPGPSNPCQYFIAPPAS